MKVWKFKKDDLSFNCLLIFCFIICGISFLNPKTLHEFKDSHFFLWILLPITIFCGAIFLTAFFRICYFLVTAFVLEIKKLFIDRDYLLILATLIGASIFTLMMFPLFEVIILFFSNALFGVKLNL